MKRTKLFLIIFSILSITSILAEQIHKTVLPNGLSVFVRKTNTLQKVSTQLWVNVGSKHEQNNERGLAHWLEHMIFKGTKKMTEPDMWLAVSKLSGSCNAATAYDWTHFYLDFPVQHWYEALPILADCLQNCTFKQDLMDAEVQVVIQELKMCKDNFGKALLYNMISSTFQDHPYHDPVIGYKTDLKTLNRDALVSFYKKYYVPGNAVLVIVGNVEPEQALNLAEKYFGPIPTQQTPAKQEFTHENDIISQTTTIYRNVGQPNVSMSYVVPGLKANEPYVQDILQLILTKMQHSRLKKLLIDKRHLVNWIYCGNLELFDYDLFRITFEPKKYEDVNKIIMLIQKEIDTIAQGNINDEEIAAAMKRVESSYYSFIESNHAQAKVIATSYLARGNENFIFQDYVINDPEVVKTKIQEFAARNLRAWVMNKGLVLPLPQEEQKSWELIQEASNKEDVEILKDKQRQTELEPPCYALTLEPKKPIDALIPQPELFKLENGLTVYYYHNPAIPKIDLILKLKADSIYEAPHQEGIFNILADMLVEGTHRYSGEQLNKTAAKHGIQLSIAPGLICMNMLKQELAKAFELMEEVVVRPTLNKAALAKIKALTLSDIHRSDYNAQRIAGRLIHDFFYDGHPFAQSSLGTTKSIQSISQKELFKFYQKYISPDGAALIIVGDLSDWNIPELIQQTIANWKGPKVPDIVWPEITPNNTKPITYHLEREQVVLVLAGLSVDKDHADFYKILLFNLILDEKLFTLRSQSGAFYTIHGDLLANSGKQPGLMCISANISQTRLEEAEAMIRQALPGFIELFDEQDLEKAKLALLNSPSEQYSTNREIAETFTFLHTEQLPLDYYAQRNKVIETITVSQVKEAVANILNPEKLVTFKVGRLNDETKE